nr:MULTISPECIES: hypothetical protein [Streptomyces]
MTAPTPAGHFRSTVWVSFGGVSRMPAADPPEPDPEPPCDCEPPPEDEVPFEDVSFPESLSQAVGERVR